MATLRRLSTTKHNLNTLFLPNAFVSLINARKATISGQQSTQDLYKSINTTLTNMHKFSNFDYQKEQLNKLAREINNNTLHENDSNQLQQRYTHLQQQLSNWKELEQNTKEYWELYELAIEDNDDSLQKDCYKQLQTISSDIEDLYYSLLLNGEDDHNGCYVQVSAGSGGSEAQDWALTLFEMYIAWSKRHKYDHKILFKKITEVGINQAALEIDGMYTYGWLRHDEGVHRRSRVSPYGQTAGKKIQTAFASVQITPMRDAVDDFTDINEKDLEWEAFRGSGPGGQHRNTTDSAVRCIHKPTGIMVTVQDERNQYGAKVAALRYLKYKLKRLEEDNLKKVKRDKYESFSESTFSSQIRNYVYASQMIKDTRTKCELRGNAMNDALKNGNIDLLLKKSVEAFNCVHNENV